MSNPLALKQLDYVILWVQNMERAFHFYTAILGLKAGYHDEHWSELELSGLKLALHVTDRSIVAAAQAAVPTLVFAVDDIAAARAVLLEKDIPVTPLQKVADMGDKVGVSADFFDPDGNSLSVHSVLSQAAWADLQAA